MKIIEEFFSYPKSDWCAWFGTPELRREVQQYFLEDFKAFRVNYRTPLLEFLQFRKSDPKKALIDFLASRQPRVVFWMQTKDLQQQFREVIYKDFEKYLEHESVRASFSRSQVKG